MSRTNRDRRRTNVCCSLRAREREREREREGEKQIDGLCEALPVSYSGSVYPGETLSGEVFYTGTTGGYMCLLVLAIKTLFSSIFDLPREKNLMKFLHR